LCWDYYQLSVPSTPPTGPFFLIDVPEARPRRPARASADNCILIVKTGGCPGEKNGIGVVEKNVEDIVNGERLALCKRRTSLSRRLSGDNSKEERKRKEQQEEKQRRLWVVWGREGREAGSGSGREPA
jgi:hypothetical protein